MSRGRNAQGHEQESSFGADLAKESLRLHRLYKGKVQVAPKCPIRDLKDFTYWYTPGVAAPCREIAADPAAAIRYTNKGNSVAIVSDGTRVLGLGDIGPAAALPVMEGKALLFKYLGGVDAVPLCLDVKDPDEFIRVVQALAPSFGGINLEDIAQPKCFKILAELRASMPIPVWHDDQQGSATAMLAALMNALQVVGKDLHRIKIAMIGMGAANVAGYALLKAAGVDPAAVVACDSKGILHAARADIEASRTENAAKWRVCQESNGERVTGRAADAMRGADVCIAFTQSGPGIIRPEWVRAMARPAIVFACANPNPEIWPREALDAGAAVVATGRGDFPNQLNNALAFPGIFRAVLDIQACTITDEMAIMAAKAIAACVDPAALRADRILPTLDNAEVAARVAAATGMAAQMQGLARVKRSEDELYRAAFAAIAGARALERAVREIRN